MGHCSTRGWMESEYDSRTQRLLHESNSPRLPIHPAAYSCLRSEATSTCEALPAASCTEGMESTHRQELRSAAVPQSPRGTSDTSVCRDVPNPYRGKTPYFQRQRGSNAVLAGPVLYSYISIPPQQPADLLTQHRTVSRAYRGLIHAMPLPAREPNVRSEYAWN